MTNTAARLLTLILLLQREPNQKAAALAEKLGVSVRSLHRYMAVLDEMGIPVYAERGPNGGFSLVRGYKMPPLIFSPEEAAAIYLGAGLVSQMWGQLYQKAAASALAKLDNVLPDAQRREIAWAQRALVAVGLNRADPERHAATLELLQQALQTRLRLSMVYRKSDQPEAPRRSLDPYAMVYRWGWWYVIGYCHLRKQVRSFRVDRIRELLPTTEHYEIPADFDPQRYLDEAFQGQTQIKIRLKFTQALAFAARDHSIAWETLQEKPDGSIEVTFLAPDLTWAASTAFSFGPGVVVLDPPELIQRVAEWARAVADLYRP